MDAEKKKTNLVLWSGALAILLLFAWLFGFHPNNDTDSFLYAIDFFSGRGSVVFPNRYLNPFYGVIASKLLFFLPSVQALIVTNIVFYIGLVGCTFGLIRRVFKSDRAGVVSALMVVGGYPMLRYGLTQVQDIGGYFWFVATLYFSWLWFESNDRRYVVLGGVATAFGVLTKESGCMGALFFGMLLLFKKDLWIPRFKNFLLFSIFPFITIIINALRSRDMNYNSAQWIIENWKIWAPNNYTLFKWAGVNATTFNILWLAGLFSLLLVFTKKIKLSYEQKIYFWSVIPASLSYFGWPVFIGRTVYIAAWLFVPFAVLSVEYLFTRSFKLGLMYVVLLLATPFILQSTLRYVHVFKIYDDCNRSIMCSWNYFWEHRSEFSKES